ncbi:uncharacterized protein G2W53_015232 [Senna tora]|uniref:Uncharacterized protein n=1 Tax=Senna tora TaxID=362788 RepID=A0A834WV05_9FABA|nr:uncharacterized protein G2W53_015232 [Senna tora]
MTTGQISRRRRLVASDLSAPSSRCSRSCRKKTQKCFGRGKEKKPPPSQKRKCLVWSVDVVDEKDY